MDSDDLDVFAGHHQCDGECAGVSLAIFVAYQLANEAFAGMTDQDRALEHMKLVSTVQ